MNPVIISLGRTTANHANIPPELLLGVIDFYSSGRRKASIPDSVLSDVLHHFRVPRDLQRKTVIALVGITPNMQFDKKLVDHAKKLPDFILSRRAKFMFACRYGYAMLSLPEILIEPTPPSMWLGQLAAFCKSPSKQLEVICCHLKQFQHPDRRKFINDFVAARRGTARDVQILSVFPETTEIENRIRSYKKVLLSCEVENCDETT